MSGYVDTYPQTQAQWDADGRLFNNQTVAVVTDGANIGRKKWFDGIQTFAQLDYIDAAGGGGGGVASVLADAPLDSSGGANPTISIDLTGASDGDVLTVDTGAAVWAPGGGTPTTVNGQGPGDVTLQIPKGILYVNTAAGGTPGVGEAALNNANPVLATTIKFDDNDAGPGAVDRSAWFASMRVGGQLTLCQIDIATGYFEYAPLVFDIISAPVEAAGVVTIGIAFNSGEMPEDAVQFYVSYAGNAQVPVINTTAAPTAIHCVVTGTTDGTGRVTVDFTAASGNRPAFSAVHFVGGSGTTGGNQLTAYIQDETLSAYVVQFWNLQAAGEDIGGSTVSFVILGIPA